METWIISDTHAQHNTLVVPKNIETVVHCGDSTNYYDLFRNQVEFEDFIKWYSELPIKNKIIIPGNHDCWATKKYNIDKVKDLGITYLEHEYFELEGRLIFGSPYTPTYGNWHFMVRRDNLSQYWESLEKDIKLLVTHGPPKGILDLSHNISGELEYCGDMSLLKAIIKNEPIMHCFGHIHDSKNCYNSGMFESNTFKTAFINASCVTDGKINQGVSSNGKIIKL